MLHTFVQPLQYIISLLSDLDYGVSFPSLPSSSLDRAVCFVASSEANKRSMLRRIKL